MQRFLRPWIVVDKSYAQGVRKADIEALAAKFRFVMPSAFFLEVLTEPDAEQRCRIASKFPPGENPGAHVHVGSLLRFEIDNRSPAWPGNQFFNEEFYFNAEFLSRTFKFRKDDLQTLKNWEISNEEQIDSFRNAASHVIDWFPEVRHVPSNSRNEYIREAMVRVGTDTAFVRGLYESFRSGKLPDGASLNEDWAIFRFIQTNLLAALRYVRKHGLDNTHVIASYLHNECLDCEYITLAALAGAFASRDKDARESFRLIEPTGILAPDKL